MGQQKRELMQKKYSRGVLALLSLLVVFFVGCSQVATPTATESDEETLENQALVYDWVDGSSNRGPALLKSGTNFLSDLRWVAARNGLGPVERNSDNGGRAAGDGGSLKVAGTTYAKGLGVHADSNIVFDLGGKCSQFSFVAGFDDSVTSSVSVRLIVRIDGRTVFTSSLAQSGPNSTSVTRGTIGITGANRLQLLVSDLDNSNTRELINWADAKVICN